MWLFDLRVASSRPMLDIEITEKKRPQTEASVYVTSSQKQLLISSVIFYLLEASQGAQLLLKGRGHTGLES